MQPGVEGDARLGSAGEVAHRDVGWIVIVLGPRGPGRVASLRDHVLRQGFVEGVDLQSPAPLVAIMFEHVLCFRASPFQEMGEQFLEHRNFKGGDAGIVDQVGLP
ncbi:hypothetical protein AUC68_00115 [Methyloceanibacter methanicus]|uniref:Uncharacterized protein n=1 Tax=Methyloceanibacter methanicus TaxID=1774968 RepID=A0A1E3W6C1_9HYPH|nr:hypothetical protein AUC68_00115 [Methyloceanibacter methanicus]